MLSTILRWVGIVLVVLVVIMLFRFYRLGSTSHKVIPELGVADGRLKPCPDSPNCVSSMSDEGSAHHIEPLTYSGSRLEAKKSITEFLLGEYGARVIEESEDYLHLTVASKLFKFMDDLEFYFPEEGIVHMRSASRVGHSDMGANRKRLQRLRDGWNSNNGSRLED